MEKLRFTLPGSWTDGEGFGCASLGLAGTNKDTAFFSQSLDGVTLSGQYRDVLRQAEELEDLNSIQAAIVLFGNAGGRKRIFTPTKETAALSHGWRWRSNRRCNRKIRIVDRWQSCGTFLD